MQEGRTRPANDDRSLFHKNRELFGVIAGAIDAAKAARAAKAAAKAGITAAKVAASPSQDESITAISRTFIRILRPSQFISLQSN
ncbi:hypothetical protein M0R45_002954 [Rubus argutus]|uniref:Uncharacterized protein n=1 Tax=Rubus argutus TaxID=59490 RepID=A0AAW1YHZ2_RUBAR